MRGVELVLGLVGLLGWLSFILRVPFYSNAGGFACRQEAALARACAVKGASPHPIGPRLLPPPPSSRSPTPFVRCHPLPATATYAFLCSHLFPRVAPRDAVPFVRAFSLSLSLSRSLSSSRCAVPPHSLSLSLSLSPSLARSLSFSCLRRALWSSLSLSLALSLSLSLDHLLCLVSSFTRARSFRHWRRDRPQVWQRCVRCWQWS